jgi:predicted dehydrogenase
MPRLRLAFIGCGSIARQMQMQWYAQMPDEVEIVALADPGAQALALAAQQTGVAAGSCYADYQELLQRADIDAVEVCTPNRLHAAPTIASLQAGKHVLCQKPMASIIADAQAMIAAAEESGKLLGVLYMNRFSPLALNIKRILDLGLLGAPTAIRARTAHAGGQSPSVAPGAWRHSFQQGFAGSFSLLATHYADLFRWFFGPVTRIAAIGKTLICDMEGDDNFAAVVEFANGRIGTLETCYHEHPGGNRVEVYGDGGTAIIEGDERSLRLYSCLGPNASPEASAYLTSLGGEWEQWVEVPTEALPALSPFANYGAHWLHCLRTGQPPVTGGREGLASLEIIVAGYQSAASGQFVTLGHQNAALPA